MLCIVQDLCTLSVMNLSNNQHQPPPRPCVMSTTAQEVHWLNEGQTAGQAAALSRGGTRGAEWYADQNGLEGANRAAYVNGFNEALDENTLEEESEP